VWDVLRSRAFNPAMALGAAAHRKPPRRQRFAERAGPYFSSERSDGSGGTTQMSS
jgi:hypothetical protein